MNDYTELRLDFTRTSTSDATEGAVDMETATDVMAQLLCEIGYESFVADDKGTTAYINCKLFDADALTQALNDFPLPGFMITATTTTVEGADWNHEWEKNYFQPIVVADKCVIHSSFHTGYPQCEYDIVIDPKMAFGTGHHATTSLIIDALLGMDLHGKSVIDMGTGTGILAILAAMRGATPVTGIEIDEAAWENACDNVRLNGHPEIELLHGDASALAGRTADVFIANINRNIITGDLDRYAKTLKPGSVVLLSGFYEADIPVVETEAQKYGLLTSGFNTKGDNWACLKLVKE